ncbi:hypothetical protein SCP_1000490 [Sparassis crispa]|uniref:C2H2-type domain-containing protein n=1 Tax=Sparassis crispa TaxID=139825 RepID=A0A401GX73_9APHY|nr:hypothetical protein SCP_1000490 [Sparassis crispa]GBE86807.1 hypothetical protein SCP_1000490 [Sparassis crispa]
MPYCARCARSFKNNQALWQHEENSGMHNVCRECEVDFGSESELISHYEDEHYYCDSCEELFDSESELEDHNEEAHWYCRSCERFFKDENSLNYHLRSSIHRPRAYACPGRKCTKAFTSHAALVNHWESGACPSGVTRESVNRVAAKLDKTGLITNPTRLLGGPSGRGESVVTQVWATERSWNGEEYECFLCHRGFRSLLALNAHLQSPVHADKGYRCPKTWRGCGKEFKTLSALCQHVESEQCGVRRFSKEMQNVIESMSSKMKKITL